MRHTRTALFALLLTAAAAPVFAQSATAPTAADRVRELLDVTFRSDTGALDEWVRTSYTPGFVATAPLQMHLGFLGMLRDDARAIEILEVRAESPTRATAVFLSPVTREYRELTVEVEPAAPYRIALIEQPRFVRPEGGHAIPTRTLTPAQAAADLDTYAKQLAAANMFSGAVLIARGGEVLFEGAYGPASREFNVPNTTGTRFIIGSINKMFTTVGILQQVEQGRLSLEDPIAKHLPGVLSEDVAAKVLIKHLLTHTSGLGDFLFTPEMQNRSRANYRSIADYLPTLAGTQLRFEPGTSWSYSNTGFLLLGAILERVSGQPYDDYVQRHVFDRVGMPGTGAPELDLVPTGLASTYQRDFKGAQPFLRNDRYVQPVRGTPAGGGFSTTTDLYRFLTALRAHRLLSAEMTATMLSPKPALASPGYGYGTQVFTPDGNYFGHTGGGPGTNAQLTHDAAADLTIVVLGNMSTGSFNVVRRARQVFGASPPVQAWQEERP